MGRSRGFTLVELLIVLAIIGLLTTMAVPGLLSARRQSNQTSAMISLRIIAGAEAAFAASCGDGEYASRLPQLSRPPEGGGPPFLPPELSQADTVDKSGYRLTLMRGSDGEAGKVDACNGVLAADLTTSFYATAEPIVQGGTGDDYFWLGVPSVIFRDSSPIVMTRGRATYPGGHPVEGAPRRPQRPEEMPPMEIP